MYGIIFPSNNSKLIYETSSIFSNLEVGKFVLVPLGKKNIPGSIIEKNLDDLGGLVEKKIKPAIEIIEDSFSLNEDTSLSLSLEYSEYDYYEHYITWGRRDSRSDYNSSSSSSSSGSKLKNEMKIKNLMTS